MLRVKDVRYGLATTPREALRVDGMAHGGGGAGSAPTPIV